MHEAASCFAGELKTRGPGEREHRTYRGEETGEIESERPRPPRIWIPPLLVVEGDDEVEVMEGPDLEVKRPDLKVEGADLEVEQPDLEVARPDGESSPERGKGGGVEREGREEAWEGKVRTHTVAEAPPSAGAEAPPQPVRGAPARSGPSTRGRCSLGAFRSGASRFHRCGGVVPTRVRVEIFDFGTAPLGRVLQPNIGFPGTE